ncbi:CGI-121-domain-containing protein [Tothia fuscella]|uniref:EKC/KEOPS complex subunit CGI121 n=1 Tax=Tothia fuscella TaxID=1048955 RepID=A0A9P4NFE8_9PEZI|nr:CGI-121-domain-containing protein [Tothia fuscella]
MSAGSELKLPHLEAYPVHVSLFQDVTNAEFLKRQLLEGNAEYEYAFLDATTIISVNHVLAAVFRAINDSIHNRLKSRNVHSEIVFSLSPNNNIAESFRRFGVSDTTNTLLAIKVLNAPNSAVTRLDPASHLGSCVEGNRIEFSDENLKHSADLPRIRKIYKLNSSDNSKSKGKSAKSESTTNGVHNEAHELKEMEAVILGIMALKGS